MSLFCISHDPSVQHSLDRFDQLTGIDLHFFITLASALGSNGHDSGRRTTIIGTRAPRPLTVSYHYILTHFGHWHWTSRAQELHLRSCTVIVSRLILRPPFHQISASASSSISISTTNLHWRWPAHFFLQPLFRPLLSTLRLDIPRPQGYLADYKKDMEKATNTICPSNRPPRCEEVRKETGEVNYSFFFYPSSTCFPSSILFVRGEISRT